MKVKYLPWQPHCFAFGGLEIQMLSTLQAVQACGVDADKLDIWSRDGNFDVLHVWGLDHIHEIAIYFAKKTGKKIVITALFQDFSTADRRLRHVISRFVGMARYTIEMAAKADSIVVVNEIEADIATRFYKIPSSKISYIPNIVDKSFFELKKSNEPFYFLKDYVLCTGNICKRKNQLNLVKACRQLGLSLVLLGNALPGEEEYGNAVKKIIEECKNMIWITGLKENSEELKNAYKNCSIFALPSLFEQGPISVYEALACRCSVLIADKNYSKQMFYRNVERVNPDSVNEIAQGLQRILDNPCGYVPPPGLMEKVKAENVGLQYKEVYGGLFS